MKNISIEDDVILKNLTAIINHPNKDQLVILLGGMIVESHKGSDLFIKLLLNENLPELPAINSVGYFKIQNTYFNYKETTKGSKFDENGFLKCIVKGYRGYHNYSQITVEFACINDQGKEATASTNLELGEFIPEEFKDEF